MMLRFAAVCLAAGVSTVGQATTTPSPSLTLTINGFDTANGSDTAYEIAGEVVPITATLRESADAAQLIYPDNATKVWMDPAAPDDSVWTYSFVPDLPAQPCRRYPVVAIAYSPPPHNPIHLRAPVSGDPTGSPPVVGPTSPSGDDPQPQLSATIDVLCPSIGLEPSAKVGADTDVVAIAATDFDPPSAGAKHVVVDGVGQVSFPVGQPASLRVPGSCGTHIVTLTQSSPFGTLQASTSLVVACPTIAVAPSSIALSDEPAPVEVTGSGFPADDPLNVEIGGSTVTTTAAGRTGAVAVALSTAGLPCGQQTVVLTSQRHPRATASAPLSVTCPVSSGSVTVRPDTVPTGSPALVTGSGFAPEAALTLTWKLADGTSEPVAGGVTTAGPDGSFAFYTLVFGGDPLGSRVLTATDGPTSATGSLLVVNGTLQPVDGTQLAVRR